MPPRFTRLAAIPLAAATLFAARPVAADGAACTQLAYTFQPDCFHADGDAAAACKQTLAHLDLGPQIAVWIETKDHVLVDTLMVTNLTAIRGIGNRPGLWNFRSGPKFPYGKRWFVLPVWAYARGKLYDSVVMQDNREDWMGFHEAHSSKETFFCRPLMQQEVNLMVDAVTCPSPNFNSAKGKLMAPTEQIPRSYYPPRNDLVTFVNQDCDMVGGSISRCPASAASYATLDDLDAVAAATPAYGAPYERTWRIPQNLPDGDYALVVEVSKEFDTNVNHTHKGWDDVHGGLSAYGIDGNLGQPSVIYRVPIHLPGTQPVTAAVSQIAGYSGTWAPREPTPDQPYPVTVALDGLVLPRDNTISTTVPGSGEMRLLEIDGPSGKGRVHVELQRCGTAPSCDGGACPDGGAPDGGDSCNPLPPVPEKVSALTVVDLEGTSASFEFVNAGVSGKAVEGYEIRYRLGTTMTNDDFAGATPAPFVRPDAPGSTSAVTLSDLKPGTQYVLGVRASDHCDQHSELAVVAFETPVMKFKQLSGCFVATAAWGSPLEPRVAALRHARDRLGAGSALFAAATDLYYRSGPAAADVVGRSDVAKAMARRVLAPFAGMAEALDAFLGPPASGGRGAAPARPAERTPGNGDRGRAPK